MSDMTTTASPNINSVQTAYDRLAYFQLRAALIFDQAADVKPTQQAMPGNIVKFTIWDDLAPNSAPINESVDVDSTVLSDSQPSVTLNEYGDAVTTSAKLRGTSFLAVDRDAANIVGRHAGESVDHVASDVLFGGSNVRYGGTATARNTVKPTDVLSAANVQRAAAELQGASVTPWMDGYYRAFIHPDVAYDLRRETGAAAWREPHVHSDPAAIWRGSIGYFESFDFIVTPTAPVLADAGSSTTLTDVYQTLFMGRQGLAKAYSSSVSAERPQVIVSPVVDKLKRFHSIGWYWLGGYGRFREASLRRVETSSSIGANA